MVRETHWLWCKDGERKAMVVVGQQFKNIRTYVSAKVTMYKIHQPQREEQKKHKKKVSRYQLKRFYLIPD